jgi:hypothetical protein
MMNEAQIYQHFKAHRYGIVDATFRENVPADWPQMVIAPEFLKDDTNRCPVLIDLHALKKETRLELLDRFVQDTHASNETFFSLLLASHEPPARIVKHLGERLKIQIKASDTPTQLRYFDPGTFLQLPNYLNNAGMAWLMGALDSVLIPWAGELTIMHKPQSNQGFNLTAQHVQTLHRITIANRVQLSMAETPKNQEAWVKQAQQIDTYIRRALAHQLVQTDDIEVFCQHVIAHHSAFDTHPKIQQLLATLANAAPEDGLDYKDLTHQLTTQDWQEIVKQLNQTQMTQTIGKTQ